MSLQDTKLRPEATIYFDRARRNARLQQLLARITGRETRLIPFETVRSELDLKNPFYRGVQNVPLDSIIGSLGRYNDFNRHFLPLTDSLRERWIGVDMLAMSSGWPPIELFKVGTAYFVKDGNHRVSVARQMKLDKIEAHVWEYSEDIALDSAETLDETFIKLGEYNFLQRTKLDDRYPGHGIKITSPGRYRELIAQIEDLRQERSEQLGEPLTFHEALPRWYEEIYLPSIKVIKNSTLLADFPDRTAADLFVWISIHRKRLRNQFVDIDNTLNGDIAPIGTGNEKRLLRALDAIGIENLPPVPEGVEQAPEPQPL